MKARVNEKLEGLESREAMKVLFAAESGSRAWGFESADSDYDVRFVYVREPKWYLSVDLERRRDVLEAPMEDELDVCGWDLRKALQLLGKSNPSLYEWFSSPVVYARDAEFERSFRPLLGAFYSPRASFYHYASMARRNERAYLRGLEVSLKKYLYVLRPLLAARWVEDHLCPPPMRFEDLLDAKLRDQRVREKVDLLLELKRSGLEMARVPRWPVLDRYVARELDSLDAGGAKLPVAKQDRRALDALFVKELERT